MNHELYKSWKQTKPQGSFDAVIIGSGIGGMACAALLTKSGKRVLVLERHYTPGGFTHTFKRNDYEWDVGVHYIGEVGSQKTMMNAVFDYISHKPIQWASLGSVYDKAFFGDTSYNFPAGRKELTDALIREFPEEEKAIREYINLLYLLEKRAFWYHASRILPSFLPSFIVGFLRNPYEKYASRTTADVLSQLTSNKKLIAVLTTQFGDYGLTPSQSSFAMHAVVARHYIEGGYYPIGGSSTFFNSIAPVITEGKGEIFVKAEVGSILVEKNRVKGVEMADGTLIKCPLVISNAGIRNTWNKLLPESVRKEHRIDEKLNGLTDSAGHFCLYIGLNHPAEELELPTSNFWIFPDTYDHDVAVENYLRDHSNPFPLVYISFPAAKDPDFGNRYPGRSTIEIITLASWEDVASHSDTKWKKRGEDYDAMKEQISRRLLEYLYKYVPSTKGKVDYYELSTPLSTQHFSNYPKGELYGLNHDPARFLNRNLKPETPLKGLYLCGQDIVTCGVGGGLMGGVLCAAVIERKNFMKLAVKQAREKAKGDQKKD
jgi:all-trans-retinol 13,14-reductase